MTSAIPTSSWLSSAQLKPDAALRLFCFPYAGGAAQIFRTWAAGLPTTVEVCPVQLPGRGSRLLEPPFTNMKSLVEAAAQALRPYLDKPFALFGHSMGATVGFELACYLKKAYGLQPAQVFVSGRTAPHILETAPATYSLPEGEFVRELSRLKGTPREVLDHPELMQLMLPVLRADFELIQTYVCSNESRIDCPLTVFGGLQDQDVSREDLDAWGQHTTGAFSLHMLPGDHFFLHTAQSLLLELLSGELSHLAAEAVASKGP